METVKFEISGMTCDDCASGIEKHFKTKEGIVSSKVSYPDKKGEFTFNPEKISIDEIRDIINGETHYQVVGDKQISSVPSISESHISKPVILQSVITCPVCGYQKEETMPTDSCQFFYECENCQTVLKPKQGDCCVYCSYGTVPCPSIQQSKDC